MDKLKSYPPLLLAGIFIIGVFVGSSSSLFLARKNQNNPLFSPTSSPSLSCTYDNQIYEDGDGFQIDCNSCSCQNGQISCTTMACDFDEGQSEPATIQPENPEQTGLSQYPDYPLNTVPTSPVSPKFLVEHRSALNGKTVYLTGVVIHVATREQTCPGTINGAAVQMCGQPFVVLADSADKNRDKNYDITIRAGEDLKETDYPLGQTVQLQVQVTGNKAGVNLFSVQ